jgi:hypothetical protein
MTPDLNASQGSDAESCTKKSKTTQNFVTCGVHLPNVSGISWQPSGIAMVASERHPPKPNLSIDRTVDGSNTEVRREQLEKAKPPIEEQPGPIVTAVSASHNRNAP